MSSASRRAASAAAATAVGLGSLLSFASPASAAIPSAAGTAGVIDIFNINDFHGRIDNGNNDKGALGKSLACTVESSKATYGDDNSVLLSAGDNIGASPFTSMSQQDKPTIDFLNALQLRSSAAGNHEFDRGYSDLTGRVDQLANFNYLGANVTVTASGQPALKAYDIIDVNGVKVGVIGAVTVETPALTGPNSTGMLTFGDPVDAVNKVADQLTDGDTGNDEADVVIAEYHEGAAGSSTLATETANSATFSKIVNQTSAKVSAIFTAHTHQTYAWDGPVPGSTGTRPVIQTGSYAANLGHVQLKYDAATKKVTSYAVENIKVPAAPAADCPVNDPQYIAAAAVIDQAVASATTVGTEVIGEQTADITTAWADGKRDDRASESTLSNMIAQSMVDVLNGPGRSGAQIGVMNPGGVRADLLKGDDGKITRAEAASVVPFANTLQTITLTGAQFKAVLEQQWQPAGASRPFLKLGLSENVTYTFDPDRAAGDRITSITVDGKPIDPAAGYTVVGASFLIGGGDNFTAFKEGTGMKDSGLIDTQSFSEWVTAYSPLSPSFAKGAVVVRDLPTTVQAGSALSFQAQGFDLTSLGSPTNTGGKVLLNGAEIGTFTIADGSIVTSTGTIPQVAGKGGVATIDTVIPAATPGGAATLQLVADQSGTTVTIPVTVQAVSPVVTPAKQQIVAGQQMNVSVSGFVPGSQVRIELHSTPVLLATVTTDVNGTATAAVTIPADTAPGVHTILATDGALSAEVTIEILAAPSTSSPSTDGAGTTKPGAAKPGATKPVAKGRSSLAQTGADVTPSLVLAGALMLAGGGFAAAGRRNRGKA